MILRYTRQEILNPWMACPWGYPLTSGSELPKTSGGRAAKARRQVFRLVQESRETYLSWPPF